METKDYWNNISDKYFKNENSMVKIIKKEPEKGFPAEVYEMIKSEYTDLKNVDVLVASSGDNIAAFCFYLLGANVTSSDLSEKQLENAKLIADENNWKINFIRSDTIELKEIEDGKYDLGIA
jgi:2-polyprenyl-3-methyl-5-hydroxy-6-metoxy-1,4-benzoquinol methylase